MKENTTMTDWNVGTCLGWGREEHLHDVSLAIYFMLLLLKLNQVTDKIVMIMYTYKVNELSLL